MSQKSKRRKLEEEFVFRGLSVSPSTVNEQERSVEAVIATEQPVMEPDFKRYEMVPRTLVMSGMTFPKQIPLLDSHNRRSVKDQLGSIRNLRVENGQLIGRLYFAADAVSEWEKVRDGHVTDVSAGFRVSKEVYVPEGETKSFNGRAFAGPQNVALASRTFEASITPIGADDQAKLRGLDPFEFPQQDEDDDMTTEQRALLLSRGMPEDLEGERAIQWALDNPDKLAQRTEPSNPGQNTSGGFSAPDVVRELDRLAQEREKAREAQRLAFRSEVEELCALADVPSEISRQLNWYDCPDVQAVRTKIRDWKVEQSKNASPALGFGNTRIVGEGRDAFRKDILTAVMSRAFRDNGVNEAGQERALPKESRGTGSNRFQHATISEIGRECLIQDGYRRDEVQYLPKADVARALFGNPAQVGLTTRDAMPLHQTSSFAYLTENVMNKNLRAGYTESRVTYDKIVKVGQSVPDFKKKAVYTTSAVGNLTAWPDGSKPDLASFMDYKDSYGVEAFAKMLEFSWQLFVNDDMGALTQSPFKMGNAARRTINAYVWSLVTGNPTLADGQTFFLATAAGNRKKANYISSGLVVTVASLSALENLMRQQVGQNTREGNTGPDILNIEPRYLITPTAIKNTAAAVVKSIADPASSNSNVHNPFSNALELISEPLLDANSTQAYYLAADPALVDGIELSFLQGFEEPKMWSGTDEKTLTKWWAIAQVYGGLVVDHRGWVKQAGA